MLHRFSECGEVLSKSPATESHRKSTCRGAEIFICKGFLSKAPPSNQSEMVKCASYSVALGFDNACMVLTEHQYLMPWLDWIQALDYS